MRVDFRRVFVGRNSPERTDRKAVFAILRSSAFI